MFIFVTYIHFRVDYTCQKPCDFKPTEGSLIMPHIAETDTHVQFSIRESSAARRDLLTKSLQLRKYLEACVSMTNNRVLGMLVLGSSERGTKVFRYSSWESILRVMEHSPNILKLLLIYIHNSNYLYYSRYAENRVRILLFKQKENLKNLAKFLTSFYINRA